MINDDTLYTPHVPDGVAETFLIGLEYLNDENNIKVTYFDGDTDEEGTLVLGVNYTVDNVTGEIITQTGAYGSGTLVSPIPDSSPSGLSKLTITLDAEYTQKTDITSNSDYDPEVLETAYDKNTILAKQNKEEANRAVTLAISDAGSVMTLPPKAELANGVLGFDVNGEPIARAGFIPEAYDVLFEYSADDIVQYGGEMWICLATDTGTTPGTDTAIWEIYVDRYGVWNAEVKYPKEVIVSYQTGIYDAVLVKSLQAANVNHAPNLAPGATDLWWEIVKTGGSLEVEGTVAAATVVNKIMYFNTSGKLATADNRELSKAICAGLLVTATTGSDEVSSVLSGGKMEGFSGLTAGIDYYLGNSGNLITKGAIGYAEYIVYIGRAISTTEMDVKVMGPEPARNQDDSIDIGNAIAVYGTTDSKGYLYADGRAISRVNYSILFGVIGTTFGVGDGSTTFNIPDQADYAALGDATLKWHIKAENVMTSGEVISAMRDDQGWVEFTGDWTNKEFIVTPAPGIGYSSIDDVYGLQVEIWLADDDTPTNPIKMLSMERAWDQAAPAAVDVLWGLGIMPNNTTSFKLQTGKDGVQYLTDNGTLRALETSTTGAYKVVITKPNLVTTIFDVSSLPQNVDLTAGNVQVTLPEITGALQTKSIYWTNGGTYKLTLAVTDAATIGGLAATIWEGESEGHIELESDGTNWQVREYKDSGTGWTKDSYGEIRFSATKTFSAVAITSATTPIPFRSDGTLSVTLPYANLIATDYRITLSFIGGIPASMINLNAKSSTSFTVYLGAYTSNGAAAGAFDYNGVGRWRT